jgi:hypothetical protein
VSGDTKAQFDSAHAGSKCKVTRADDSVLGSDYKLWPCYDKNDCECGCMQPLIGKPTCGNSRKRRAQPSAGKENVKPAERRSKRQKQAVNYCEVDDQNSGTVVEAGCCAQYRVPQCSAHGRFAQHGFERAVNATRSVLSRLNADLIVVLQWKVAVTDPSCNGVDRANGTARRGDQKGQSSGQWASGKLHSVDVVVARQHDNVVVALAGVEVQGSSHKNQRTKEQDAGKSEWAGFKIEAVDADDSQAEMEDIIEGMLDSVTV